MTDAARPVAKRSGALRIARVAGIDVHVHWTWAAVALFEFQARGGAYANNVWNGAEYLCLFAIVLLHEFGHALACRSVGGVANDVLLWPLGGVAYVKPPFRAGAHLWSIAAGPLVNVVLLPVTIGLAIAVGASSPGTDPAHFTKAVAIINGVVLLFNLLPVYPLDGGQILRSLLWYAIGPYRSLVIAAVIGLAGAAVAAVFAVLGADLWLGVLAVFGGLASWGALARGRRQKLIATLGRHGAFACPSCREPPPVVDVWPCAACRKTFDPFASAAACPACAAPVAALACLFCGDSAPPAGWPVTGAAAAAAAAPPPAAATG